MTTRFCIGLVLLIASVAGAQESPLIRVGPGQVTLIELYTSEGCSSCPPADRWLSSLRSAPNLWTGVVPVAFHVTYWDSLGWDDPFAKPAFTERQRRYAAAWGSDTVYTPGLVRNGREWRGWGRGAAAEPGRQSGILTVSTGAGGGLAVRFEPSEPFNGGTVHAAWLGFDRTSKVLAGENRGRVLPHDFVALDEKSAVLTQDGAAYRALIPASATAGGKTGLAVWITAGRSPAPIQAGGAYLP